MSTMIQAAIPTPPKYVTNNSERAGIPTFHDMKIPALLKRRVGSKGVASVWKKSFATRLQN